MQFWYCLFLEVKEMGSQWKEGKLIQLFLRFSWLVVIDMIRCTCRETCCQVCVFTDCLFLYRRRLNRVSICRTHFAKLGHGGRKCFINYSHNHSTWCTVWNELLREKAEVVSWVPLSSFDIAYQFPWGLKWAAKERLMLQPRWFIFVNIVFVIWIAQPQEPISLWLVYQMLRNVT